MADEVPSDVPYLPQDVRVMFRHHARCGCMGYLIDTRCVYAYIVKKESNA